MSIHNKTKINSLLQHCPQGAVMITSWLEQQGVSRLLLAKYKQSRWLDSIGKGAFKRSGDAINWRSGVYAIQTQANTPIHVGGLTAIVLQGAGHYIRFKQNVQLFGQATTNLPQWFKNYHWEETIEYYRNTLWLKELAITEYADKTFTIKISSLERAMMECLYLAPLKMDLVECYQIMEGLTGLRPRILQELLEKCSSIKVKRLFLYMAQKANHAWLPYIDMNNIGLGRGKRSLVKNGVYDAKYAITIPKELAVI
jgi:hypothetical protein